MIFEELYGEYDSTLLHFAITCKAILTVSERHVIKFYEELYYSWRDCRLICTGDELDNDDVLPAGAPTNTEREWVASLMESWSSCYSLFASTFKTEPKDRWRWFTPLDCWVALYDAQGRHGYTSLKGVFEVDADMTKAFCQYKRVSLTSRKD